MQVAQNAIKNAYGMPRPLNAAPPLHRHVGTTPPLERQPTNAGTLFLLHPDYRRRRRLLQTINAATNERANAPQRTAWRANAKCVAQQTNEHRG